MLCREPIQQLNYNPTLWLAVVLFCISTEFRRKQSLFKGRGEIFLSQFSTLTAVHHLWRRKKKFRLRNRNRRKTINQTGNETSRLKMQKGRKDSFLAFRDGTLLRSNLWIRREEVVWLAMLLHDREVLGSIPTKLFWWEPAILISLVSAHQTTERE